MSDQFLGELKCVSFNFAPKGWAECNGQLLPINQNQALFSLLGTTYGGDGRVTFGLPNLEGRAAVHIGQGIMQGQRGRRIQSHTEPHRDAATSAYRAGDQRGGKQQYSPEQHVCKHYRGPWGCTGRRILSPRCLEQIFRCTGEASRMRTSPRIW